LSEHPATFWRQCLACGQLARLVSDSFFVEPRLMPQVQLLVRVLAVVGVVIVVGAALLLWLAHAAPRPDNPAPLESEVVR